MAQDNYFEVAEAQIGDAIQIMAPNATNINDPMWFALQGMLRLAQGLRQHHEATESRLAAIEKALRLR